MPRPLDIGRDNLVGTRTSTAKLNGRVYTPATLARVMVDRLPLEAGARWLDPACGDGVFLEAALERAAEAGISVTVHGWDLDPEALEAAARRLARFGDAARLSHLDALESMEGGFEVVVGNPPYLEAKRMPDDLKARVRARTPIAARGAFDLYAAFVELGLEALSPAGTLALLIPNRVLVTGSAAALRGHLLESGAVRVVDLSRADVFGADAAVYPVVLEVARGAPGALRVETLEAPPHFEVPAAGLVTDVFPVPSPGADADVLGRVLAAGHPPLSASFEVRWAVSFHRAGLRDRFVFDEKPQSPHARPFVGGGRWAGNREVEPYRLTWAGSWIDYDEARAKAEKNPLPKAALFDGPKVVICQNARRARAALDPGDHVVKDTFLVARPTASADPRWLVLVLNSALFHQLYEGLYGGTRKAGGYLHFLGRYLLPVPLPPSPDPERVEELHDALARGEDRRDEAEALVRAAYGESEGV